MEMFERMTPELMAEIAQALDQDLSAAVRAAQQATDDFLGSVAKASTWEEYRDAYDALESALGTGYGQPEEPAVGLLDAGRVVSRAWRRAEETRRPDGYLNPVRPSVTERGEWAVAELLLDRAGDAVLFSEMQDATENQRWSRLSGSSAADLVVDVANINVGRLAPARTKVGGKSAYLVRRSDERPEGNRWSSYEIPELARA